VKLFPATTELLLGHMRSIGGFVSLSDATDAALVVLATLREGLGDAEAAAMVRDLPAVLAAPLREGRYRGDVTPADLYAAVARGERASRGIGIEHAQVVLRAVGDALSDDTRALLERTLSPAWTDLIFPGRGEGEAQPHGGPKTGDEVRMTLSSAHPGYRATIAEGNPDRAQSESIARSDDPHARTKLSSGRPR
jgi:uncharacterized protein (DUF2267 family)